MQPLLFRGPDFLLAVVSSWLGLSLLVRAPRDRTAQAFAWFCLTLALYGITALIPLLTKNPTVAHAFDRAQLVATALAPVAFLHFIVVLIADGRVSPIRRVVIAFFYVTGIALAGYAILGPIAPVPVETGLFRREPSFPGALYWASVAQIVLPLTMALGLMWLDYRRAVNDAEDRRLRRIFIATSSLGVLGAFTGVIARALSQSPVSDIVMVMSHAIARTLILGAMIVLAYAVLSLQALLPKRVARRTFFYSLIGSLLTTVYVGLLLVLEVGVRAWLEIDVPLVTAFALVLLVASLGPLGEWFREQLDRRFYKREFDYGRLVHALSNELFERGDLPEQLQALLTAICRVLWVRDGLVAVATPQGVVVQATHGQVQVPSPLPAASIPDDLQIVADRWEPWPAARFLLPLRSGDEYLGLIALGARRFERSFAPVERGLLDYISSYAALVVGHERARSEQESIMKELARQSEALQLQQEELAEALKAAHQPDAPTPPVGGLRVYALGSLRVERNGEVITRWGGDKAGTHQAEALFALLFDRRGRGISKDDAVEVIWADADLEDTKRIDNAFHRTLTGLRRTLEPDLKHASKSQIIRFHRSRYWLEPGAIAWCDTDTFVHLVERGTTWFHQGRHGDAIETLKQAVQYYRGDYMDDCPFFGDSVYVEESRQNLLTRYIQAQIHLSVLYELQGRMGEAATAFQEAEAAQRRLSLINPDAQQDLEEQRKMLLERARSRGLEVGD